jgi:voltage-gated potassium channel
VASGTDGGTVGRRAIAGTVLQSLATTTLLLVVYYQAPLDRPLTAVSGLLFVTALVLLGAVVAYELRGILQSQQPRLRAVRAFGVGLPLLLVVFAATYCVVAGQQPGAFSEPLDRTDGLYFTVTVFATVGFGDIAPVSELARVLVTIQMLIGLLAVGLVAKLVFGAVQVATTRRAQQREPEPAGEGSASQP